MIQAFLLTHFLLAQVEPVAVISLYNPTAWAGPLLVEVPTGVIAAPGLLNWRAVRLQAGERAIPFGIREGGAHWRTRFARAMEKPRAEDLLVFTCAVPPGEWVRVQVLEDPSPPPEPRNHLLHENGRYTVEYRGVKAAIEEGSGRLLEFSVGGGSLLTGPMSIDALKLTDENPYTFSGGFAVGYAVPEDPDAPRIALGASEAVACRVTLRSVRSTDAMTELNFCAEVEQGPTMAWTYRFYANGTADILADGMDAPDASPWCNHAMVYRLPLAGTKEVLPYLEDRFPFYGFKGYTASVKQAAEIWRGAQGGVLELGEESINGRRWARRLVPFAQDPKGLVEGVDEGLIVDVLPKRATLPDRVKIASPDSAHVVAEMLSAALRKAGCEVSDSAEPTIRIELVPNAEGIEGDGFDIRAAEREKEWRLRAGTLNGLYQAGTAVARRLAQAPELPLIARNPAVDLRAGGFGGGDVEVDFPYGSEEEWKRVLENLLASGMNYFACLGMWGNWKMPVRFAHMPELRSDAPDAYDESSGAKFSEVDAHREKSLRLTQFLHERGGRVWLWIPIGCVPTTFAQRFPEAMAPVAEGGHSQKVPCFTHPDYRRYVDAFFSELLETYPIDGFVLIRDDNGGLCTCERCKEFTARSRTKNAAWEQYLGVYDLLRGKGLKGDIAVYPYNDGYRPELEPLLPKDLYVIGHGGEAAVLTRDFKHIGLMGDTWLDNPYANFRIPPAPRMRRLLSDRGSFWIGGAYCGTELPWESVGRFGWEPTATPNTLRYEWGTRTFGAEHAITFVRMSQVYEHLWEINARYLPPGIWMNLDAGTRKRVLDEGVAGAALLRERLEALKVEAGEKADACWFGHVELFAPFIEYHLHRLDLFSRMYDLVVASKDTLDKGERLPEEVRQTILGCYKEMYEWASKYDTAMKAAPDGMLGHCRGMTSPYKEFMAGYDQWLEWRLKMKQFAGTMKVSTGEVKAGQAFAVRIELRNTGVCPWIPGVGQELRFSGAAESLHLPKTWAYEGEWLAPGESRTVELQAVAPASPGNGVLKTGFVSPFRVPEEFIQAETPLAWN